LVILVGSFKRGAWSSWYGKWSIFSCHFWHAVLYSYRGHRRTFAACKPEKV